jgi:glycosyltransferase involved in cell wall biosynthesis
MHESITPLILTYNEAPNIRRTLAKLSWSHEIVLVDSFSTDDTVAIARSFPRVKLIQRHFDTHSAQWNFGLDACQSEWVLSLDADYVLSDELISGLENWYPASDVTAYYARFVYCVFGRPLRGTIYPPRPILFRRDRCRYYQDGHTQALRIEGQTGWLKGAVSHDDRKPLGSWLAAQDRYEILEAGKLANVPSREWTLLDRLRRCIVIAPVVLPLYMLIMKGLIFGGWPAWYYVFQRTLVEILLSLRLLEMRCSSAAARKESRAALNSGAAE